MSAHDISRHLHNPENHYTGLRMQQGRVALDSDVNEARMLDDEEQRKLAVDVIGPHGSPDSGFAIAGVTTTGSYDFDILAGTYYLGGYRHEISGPTGPLSPQTFRGQTDWRQFKRSDEVPQPPSLPAAARNDLVFLVGWEQGVSVVEDSELREAAIAGHDTGYRIRRMHRVQVRTDVAGSCKDAFAALIAELEAGGHVFDRANYELHSGARLKVIVDPITTAEDLCRPPALQGFTGAENQAIRIQLFGAQRFLWSLDNAAPLYRLKVAADGSTVTLLTAPADAAHLPLVGQILEILPWGAALPNGEYVADHEVSDKLGGGVLARILTPYDPATGTLTVAPQSAAALSAIQAWFAAETIAVDKRYLFGRLWNPGDDAVAGQFGTDFDLGEVIRLRGTGLKISFEQGGIVGDHWIVGSRPSTPHPLVPWDLHQRSAPHGPRRFYSPLALLGWTKPAGVLAVAVHACRRTFRPLTRLRGCCTVTVGDGRTSFGDFTSINEALQAIPLLEPGRICVLPGEYFERVIVDGRSNIVIEGCGARTVLRTPTNSTTSAGLISLSFCTNITIRDMRIEAVGQFGVMVIGGLKDSAFFYCRELLLENLDITTRRAPGPSSPSFAELKVLATPAGFPLSTVAVFFTARIKVLNCNLNMVGDLSPSPTVHLNQASYVLIRDCRILTTAIPGGISRAWGGVQAIGGLHVKLERNEIAVGLGHGVTLGTVSYGTAPAGYTGYFAASASTALFDDEDCPGVGGDLPYTILLPGDATPVEAAFGAAPSLLSVVGNHIHSMGGSGIAVIGFIPDPPIGLASYSKMVHAQEMVVADNIIENNYRRPAAAAPSLPMTEKIAFGGIVLGAADGLRVHDNMIQNNGIDHRFPVCGVFIYNGEDVVVENNIIRGNGKRVAGAAFTGNRAGVAMKFVGRRLSFDAETDAYEVDDDSLMPAARVRGNVVHQPAGRALEIYGLGGIFVEGNTLVSEGLTGGESPDLAHCIEIQNLGQSSELVLAGLIPSNLAYIPSPPLPPVALPPADDLLDGRILFTDNQVHFKPVLGASSNINWAVRLQSYGDVAVLDNQFLTVFPNGVGSMFCDTKIIAWSTRTNNNRWEDPFVLVGGEYQTEVSASTLARMNFTAFNQASRCIHIDISPNSPFIDKNPYKADLNQTYTTCVEPGFAGLLVSP